MYYQISRIYNFYFFYFVPFFKIITKPLINNKILGTGQYGYTERQVENRRNNSNNSVKLIQVDTNRHLS
jgi:hypothetical protein